MAFDDAAWVLNKLSALIGSGVKGVKQVARGTYTFDGTSDATITTGATVDPSKTIVLINSGLSSLLVGASLLASQTLPLYQSVLTGMTSTTITLSSNYSQTGISNSSRVYGKVSWQLIEFY